MLAYAATVAVACVFTEFVGYWLHILLHSHRVEFLSRNHMIHHLVVYAPNAPQRQSNEYLSSTYDRANVLGVGLEWVLPAAIILSASLATMHWLGIAAGRQAVFVVVSLAWGWWMFGYMHDSMHLKEFWMLRSGRLQAWFLRARKLHDIHHMALSDEGSMPYNFGICFFAFDRLFGTILEQHQHFNRPGLAASLQRYSYATKAAGVA